MRGLIFAIKHKFDVQFKYKLPKTKMKKNTRFLLDGSEKSMIPIIKSNAEKLSLVSPGKKDLVALEEFSAGTGISDLTVFTVDSKVISDRKKSNKHPITSQNQVQVLLAVLDRDSVSIQELASVVKLSIHTLQKILAQLTENNVLIVEDGRYRSSYTIAENTSENIIAIEAKVKDWKSGVRQAMRYKEYADYSYLAIYEDNINGCLDNINVFEQLGIGLIGVSDAGVTVHLDAKYSNMINPENKTLAFERLISAIDERYETFIAGNGFVANHA